MLLALTSHEGWKVHRVDIFTVQPEVSNQGREDLQNKKAQYLGRTRLIIIFKTLDSSKVHEFVAEMLQAFEMTKPHIDDFFFLEWKCNKISMDSSYTN
ncbi:hypothetical protein CR513_29007, partial [Mucuna pruriens]